MTVSTTQEALRRVIATEVGPRRPGAIYANVDGSFLVLELVTDPARAQQMLRRNCARWALIVRDTLRADGEPFVVGTAWTNSDWLIRAADDATDGLEGNRR